MAVDVQQLWQNRDFWAGIGTGAGIVISAVSGALVKLRKQRGEREAQTVKEYEALAKFWKTSHEECEKHRDEQGKNIVSMSLQIERLTQLVGAHELVITKIQQERITLETHEPPAPA